MSAEDVPFDQRAEAVEEEDRVSSWEPEDLTAYLDGTHVPEEPTLMPRSDGACLLYPRRVHSFHGESESGKSMIAQAEAARVLKDGGTAAYLDFESDASVVVTRLLQMGVPAQAIKDGFTYLRPDVEPLANERDRISYRKLLAGAYTIAVIDGVTEAATVFGVASKDNDEITKWIRSFARKLAQRTGAAVIQVDHVTKDADSRGRFAIGGGAKMNALDGTAFVVEVKEPLGVGMRGVVVMRVAKDRPGRVRPRCGKWRASDRTQEAARVVVDSTVENVITVTVEPYADAGAEAEGKPHSFRPTVLMERVSRYIESKHEPPSENDVVNGVQGKTAHKKAALEILIEEGFVNQLRGPRNAKLHRSVQSYRQVLDPASDRYDGPRVEVDAEEPPDDPSI